MTNCKGLLQRHRLSISDREQLKREFRKWALKNHPDKGGNSELFKTVNSCKEEILKLLEKSAASRAAAKKPSPRKPAKKPSPRKPAKKPATRKTPKKPAAKRKPRAGAKKACGKCTGQTLEKTRCKALVACRKGLKTKCWRHSTQK
jgi:hypothetical protein